jgi:hypothetical protein
VLVPINDLRITKRLVVKAFLAITGAGATTEATTALDFFTGISNIY